MIKLSKLFSRVFTSTLFLYVFFLVTSFFVGFYNHQDYIYYNIGLALALVFMHLISVGLARREFSQELRRLVIEAQKNSKFIR